MIKWIKNKLIRFVGLDQLVDKHNQLRERYINLEKMLHTQNDKLYHLKRQNEDVLNKNDYIMSYFNVSADIYPPSREESWAVISIQGKPEYVKFVSLSNANMREIHNFLKMFEKTNRRIDAPIGMKYLFE